MVNGYLARMTPIILEHGGTISDFIGDGILAVFGAPIAHGDDVDQAARCARNMQRAMHLVNAENRDLGLPDLAMGIAVHAGPVVAGNIGSPDRVKYGVVGAAVNLASRIQALAAGGEVIISEAALKRLGPIARVGPARYVRVKGIADPVAVHELIGFADSAPAGEHTARHPAAGPLARRCESAEPPPASAPDRLRPAWPTPPTAAPNPRLDSRFPAGALPVRCQRAPCPVDSASSRPEAMGAGAQPRQQGQHQCPRRHPHQHRHRPRPVASAGSRFTC